MKAKKNIQEVPNYEALSIAKYLLSLDLEYFQVKFDDQDNNIGNLRMNRILHLLQILYYSEYNKLLFSDEVLAFGEGPIVYRVYRYFAENDNEGMLDIIQDVEEIREQKIKKFIKLCFRHFQTYNDKGLENLCKSDPAWLTVGQQNPTHPDMKFTEKENQEFYKTFCPNRLRGIEKHSQ